VVRCQVYWGGGKVVNCSILSYASVVCPTFYHYISVKFTMNKLYRSLEILFVGFLCLCVLADHISFMHRFVS
jgi:hypothetical protein